MSAFEEELERRLRALEEQNLLRSLRRVSSPQQETISLDGREFLNFSSNDYLGLATHPKLQQAAADAARTWGAGSGASRLISGSLRVHHELEDALSQFKGTQAALVFSTGYATALGTITALVGKNDIILLDRLVHASIVDAARLSGATLRVFHHNDPADLEEILRWTQSRSRGQVLIVTESLFSMDGDIAPLRNFVDLKDQYGAWLMVDEAHATGIFGSRRRGLVEELDLSDCVEIQMGTLGKALGAAGGYIVGSRPLIDFLVNRARSFIFSTAPPPASSAAARAALEIVGSSEGANLARKLRANIDAFRSAAPSISAPGSPIIPVIAGGEREALEMAGKLREQGIFIPAIRYPSVARGKARLRFTLSSAHSLANVERACTALNSLIPVQ